MPRNGDRWRQHVLGFMPRRLGNEVEDQAGDIEVERLCKTFPTGDGVDFDRVKAAITTREQIDASERGVNGGGCAARDFDERIVGYERLGDGTTADIRAPVELIFAAHAQNTVANDEQADVVAFVLDEFLEIEHCTELGEHSEGTEGEIFVREPSDAAAFAAEERL